MFQVYLYLLRFLYLVRTNFKYQPLMNLWYPAGFWFSMLKYFRIRSFWNVLFSEPANVNVLMVWLVYRAVLARCTMTILAIHRSVYIDWKLNTIAASNLLAWKITRLKTHESLALVENQKKLNLMNLVSNEALLILQSTHFRIRLRHHNVIMTSLSYSHWIRNQYFQVTSIQTRSVQS